MNIMKGVFNFARGIREETENKLVKVRRRLAEFGRGCNR
jgi:hypothetical protein